MGPVCLSCSILKGDKMESSVTSSSVPTTSSCHTERCVCSGLMQSVDKYETWKCEECGVVESQEQIDERNNNLTICRRI